jgi:hypothetical protein
VKRIQKRRPILIRRALLYAFALLVLACEPAQIVKLHYLNGYVPGSQRPLPKISIRVMPLEGTLASGTHVIGAIFDADGTRHRIGVSDLGDTVRSAIIDALRDTGITPAESAPMTLGCAVGDVSFEKRFTSEKSIHGAVFTMHSRIALACDLHDDPGHTLYRGDLLGTEDEPPAPVHKEAFLPLQTQPEESLSVAMSRAVGGLLANPAFRRAIIQAANPP